MIGALSAYSRVYNVNLNNVNLYNRQSMPETPVQPVKPVSTVTAQAAQPVAYNTRLPSEFSEYTMPVLPSGYAADMANRSRVEYPQGQEASSPAQAQAAAQELPSWPGANAAETLVRMRIQYGPEAAGAENAETGAVAAQEALEEGTCETCEKRKYQDGSDDPGVSFKTPTSVAPEQAAAAVRGHEMEHVVREQAKAQQEDRKVVSQTVTLHTDICPECGKAYISGGTTRTVTKANPEQAVPEEEDSEAA